MLITVLLLTAAGWIILEQSQDTKTVVFTIPSGTAEQLEAGNELVTFPDELALNIGDTLVVENQDDAVHAFGPFTVLPHTTLTKQFSAEKVYQNACTFHQDRQMTLVVNPAP